MSDPDASRKLILSLYDLRLENDEYAIRQVCSPELVFEVKGTSNDAALDPVVGDSEAIRSTCEYITSHWRWISQDIHEILTQGHSFAVRYTVTMEYLPLKRRVVMDIADFLTIKDGLLVKLIQYLDTAMIQRLVEEHERQTDIVSPI